MKESVVLAAARSPLSRRRVCYACAVDRPKGTPFPKPLRGKTYLHLGHSLGNFVYCRKHERRGLERHGLSIYDLRVRLEARGLLTERRRRRCGKRVAGAAIAEKSVGRRKS